MVSMIRMLFFWKEDQTWFIQICSNGMILNADCHAAANIMRKAIPDIWKDTRDYTFLSAPDVYGFHKLNPKGIPVKGIAA